MTDTKPKVVDFPTGIQQQNLESKLEEIRDKSDLKDLKRIKTKRFWTLYHRHTDAMEYGESLGADFYNRSLNIIWSTYRFYRYKN